MVRPKTVKFGKGFFENRAWEKAEHPRLVSKPVRIGKSEYVFEIGYHHPMKKYMVDVDITRNWGRGYPETYGQYYFFDSISDAKQFVRGYLKRTKEMDLDEWLKKHGETKNH